jgi:hypothetical protein
VGDNVKTPVVATEPMPEIAPVVELKDIHDNLIEPPRTIVEGVATMVHVAAVCVVLPEPDDVWFAAPFDALLCANTSAGTKSNPINTNFAMRKYMPLV